MAQAHKHGILHREKRIVTAAERTGEFSTMVECIRGAGMEAALEGPGPYTLFAPTDAAFSKLPAGHLDGLLNDQGRLDQFVRAHVVPGNVLARDAFSTKKERALDGNDLTFDTCDDLKVNGATVVIPDIECRNGMIQGVDSVLVPVAAPVVAKPASCGVREAAPAPVPAPAPKVASCGVRETHAATPVPAPAPKVASCGVREARKEPVKEAPKARPAVCGAGAVHEHKAVREPEQDRVIRATVVETVVERPIAQCTTCGDKVQGSSADDTRRRLLEHERTHEIKPATEKAAVVNKAKTVTATKEGQAEAACGCGRRFSGSTESEARGRLHDHEMAEHGGIAIGNDGPIPSRSREYGSAAYDEGRSVAGRVRDAGEGAVAGAAGATGAAVGGARGLLHRAEDALRGRSHVLTCAECGEEVSGVSAEDAQANLLEHNRLLHSR